MIHSLSGGVIKDNESFLFAKVEVNGIPYWYLAPMEVKAEDKVLVPFGRSGAPQRGVVLKTEVCSAQVSPVPMNRIKEIIQVVND